MNSCNFGNDGIDGNELIARQTSLLKLLSDNNRLKILYLLWTSEHSVGQLRRNLGQTQSLVSHHLMRLRRSGLVGSKKKGREMIYVLTQKGRKMVGLIKRMEGFWDFY